MSRILDLDDFGTDTNFSNQGIETASTQETNKLAAFEQGYKAGWDDANKAQTEESQALSADLEANLRDLSFTFHEAKAHVLKGVEPLIKDMIATVLPATAKASLPNMVAEFLQKLTENATSGPILLVCASETLPLIEGFVPEDPGFPLQFQEDNSLTSGQVFLRFGSQEQLIDLAGAIEQIETIVADFFALNERLEANG